jgi:YVTN family beta-propeller protein
MRLSPRLSLFLTLAWTLVLLGGWALLVEMTSEAAPLAYGSCVDLTVLGHIPVGDDPRGIAVVGDKVYVANHDDDTISVINAINLTVTQTITAGISDPCSIAYNPNNGYLYVTNRPDSGTGTVAVINPTTGLTVTDPIAVGTKPTGLAVNPDDGCVYVANLGSSTVSVISNTNVITTIATGGEPSHIAINSVRDLVYVTDHDTDDSNVIVIDGATRSYSQTIDLDPPYPEMQAPWGIAVDSDTGWIYVATIDGGRLVRIRPTHTVSDAIETPIIASLRMAAIDPFLNLVFVTQDDLNTMGSDPDGSHHAPPTAEMENVLTYDLETENWASDFITMPVQQDPERGIAFDTVRHRLYVSNRRSNTVTVIEETLCKDYMPIIMKSFS